MGFVASEISLGSSTLYIETAAVAPPSTSGPTPAGVAPDDLLGKLASVGDTAGKACVQLYDKLEAAFDNVRPAEVSIEFSISLGGEAGVPFVAKGTAEAAFKVSATWKPA